MVFAALVPPATTQEVNYTYDALGRLIVVNRGSTVLSYAYDPADNRSEVGTIQLQPVIGTDDQDWIYAQKLDASGMPQILNDEVFARAGVDVIFGSFGTDLINGEADWDYMLYAEPAQVSFTNLGGGSATVQKNPGLGTDTLTSIQGVYYVATGQHFPLLYAMQQPNIITGTAGDDQALEGTAGDDRLRGLAGNDFFAPGCGFDVIEGGPGTGDVVFYEGLYTGFPNTITFQQIPFNTKAYGAIYATVPGCGEQILVDVEGAYFFPWGQWVPFAPPDP